MEKYFNCYALANEWHNFAQFLFQFAMHFCVSLLSFLLNWNKTNGCCLCFLAFSIACNFHFDSHKINNLTESLTIWSFYCCHFFSACKIALLLDFCCCSECNFSSLRRNIKYNIFGLKPYNDHIVNVTTLNFLGSCSMQRSTKNDSYPWSERDRSSGINREMSANKRPEL